MSGGPIVVFDKSFLQGLSAEEAGWFDNLYMANITPLFFVETLADLEKEVRGGRSPEDIVGSIASKTPVISSAPNIPHEELCGAELAGYEVGMRGIPCVRADWVKVGDQRGARVEHPPEMRAFERWTDGHFLQVEREFAQYWRSSLTGFNLDAYRGRFRSLGVRVPKVRSLDEARRTAAVLVRGDGRRHATLIVALETLGVPREFQKTVVKRWKSLGRPAFPEFAPYSAYVLQVNFFFYLAIEASLESAERASHAIDLAYIYYLPFCNIFVSDDNFHRRVVPHFLGNRQQFIRGRDLKADLAKLDQHYSSLPASVRERGMFSLASHPPIEGDFLTSQLWDIFLQDWREYAEDQDAREEPPPRGDENLIKFLDQIDQAANVKAPLESEMKDPEFMQITRKVPLFRGRWKQFPPGIEADNSDAADENPSVGISNLISKLPKSSAK